jgi:intracellular multiplication protein IcmG
MSNKDEEYKYEDEHSEYDSEQVDHAHTEEQDHTPPEHAASDAQEDTNSDTASAGGEGASSKHKLAAKVLGFFDIKQITSLIKTPRSAVIALIILVFIVFSIFQSCSSSSSAPKPTVQTLTQAAPKPTSSAADIAASAANTSAQMATQTANNNSSQINTLQRAIVSQSKQIGSLTSGQSELVSSLSKVATTMQAISDKQLLAQKSAQQSKHKPEKAKPPKLTYHLQAIVPGRAWLQDSRGVITTVAVGDKLPGYGVIQYLSVDKGKVLTSIGTVISSPN